MSSVLRIGFSLMAVVALAASAALQPKPEVPPYNPNYAYAPEADPSDTTAPTGSFVVVEPAWGKDVNDKLAKAEELIRFRSALAAGTSEVLLAKKFQTKGPVPSVDEMTFSEKKETQMALTTELQLALECDAKATGRSWSSGNTTYQDYQYTTALKGAVVVKVIEPQSKELLWQKKVDLEGAPYVTKVNSTSQGSFCYAGLSEWPVEHRNALYQALEAQYGAVLQKVDATLSKAEVAQLSKQAEEIKSKKVY